MAPTRSGASGFAVLPGFVLRATGSDPAICRAFAPEGAMELRAEASASCSDVGFAAARAIRLAAIFFEARGDATFFLTPLPVGALRVTDAELKAAILRVFV